MKQESIRSKKSLFLMIATLVLALLLVMQVLITAWLFPDPVRLIDEHPYISDSEVQRAADTLERIFVARSLRARLLLLKVSYRAGSKGEESYLKYHPELDKKDVIYFQCTVFSPYGDGAYGWDVIMVRDSKGKWCIATEGTSI